MYNTGLVGYYMRLYERDMMKNKSDPECTPVRHGVNPINIYTDAVKLRNKADVLQKASVGNVLLTFRSGL